MLLDGAGFLDVVGRIEVGGQRLHRLVDAACSERSLGFFGADRCQPYPEKDEPRIFQRCTVGALRAQAVDVDLTLLRGKGGKPPTEGKPRTVTAGDVMKQLATALDGQTSPKTP